MKNTLLAIAASLMLTTSAFATDLPTTKGEAPAPVFSSFTFGPYAGLNVGTTTNKVVNTSGAQAGFDFGLLRTEIDYDRLGFKNGQNAWTGDLIAQHHIGNLVPYVLVGAGYVNGPAYNQAVWNAGGGVRFDVTKNVALDVRYRYVDTFQSRATHSNLVTAGIQYKF